MDRNSRYSQKYVIELGAPPTRRPYLRESFRFSIESLVWRKSSLLQAEKGVWGNRIDLCFLFGSGQTGVGGDSEETQIEWKNPESNGSSLFVLKSLIRDFVMTLIMDSVVLFLIERALFRIPPIQCSGYKGLSCSASAPPDDHLLPIPIERRHFWLKAYYPY